ELKQLIRVTEESLERAIAQCHPNKRLGDVGWAVQEIAEQYHLPTITMVQSGGAFLPDIAGIFPDKRIMTNIIRQSAKGIPQIASVHGPSTAGGAYIPALCDENIIVKNQGAMFLGGPQLTFAATGEQVDVE
ncbi:MAG TPA: hypothetical protein DCZ12_15170, partial [Gammaproteobacteria bacterium]|nr:hypothetical protein [Gammaproteobacteria bacterium]